MINTESSTQLTRRQYQKQLQKHRRRVRKRRRSRVRRVRFLRSLRTTRFWTRVFVVTVCLLMLAFWSKFAFVYNIPSYAQRGELDNVKAYVTVKPWWFGPPIFNLEQTSLYPLRLTVIGNQYDVLLQNLGKYQSILQQPQFIWVRRG